MGKLENKFQHELIGKIKDRFPGAIVMKNDSSYIQGIPDLTILYKNKWAMLECKRDPKAHKRPNQDYYVNLLNEMSFASFIDPENEEEVLDAISQSFKSSRSSRVSRSK